MGAEVAQTDDGADERITDITAEADAMQYQGEHWREDIAILESELDESINFKKATLHSTQHGLEGYKLHFGFKYLPEHAVKAINALGFEIVSMATESHRDEADFRVRVRRTRPSMSQERRRMDGDHYLLDGE